MPLSVGFGRIVNDPDASIRTRQALGRLSTPGLLVTDQGLTINSDGRMVLRVSNGLKEDASGLSLKVKAGGGIVSNEDGVSLDDPLGDITVTNLSVLQNASVTGDLDVFGSVHFIGSLDVVSISSQSIDNSGNITTGSATIVGNASVGGTFTITTLSVSGDATVGGSLVVSGNVNSANMVASGNINGQNIIAFNNLESPVIRIAGGTIITRVLSFFVTLSLGLGARSPNSPTDYFVSVPGADANDQVIVNPLSVPGINVSSWSAAMNGSGNAVVRVGFSDILGSTASITFRITVIGFA